MGLNAANPPVHQPSGMVAAPTGPVGLTPPPMFDTSQFREELENTLERHRNQTNTAFEDRLEAQHAYLEHAMSHFTQYAPPTPDMSHFEHAMAQHFEGQRSLVHDALQEIYHKIPGERMETEAEPTVIHQHLYQQNVMQHHQQNLQTVNRHNHNHLTVTHDQVHAQHAANNRHQPAGLSVPHIENPTGWALGGGPIPVVHDEDTRDGPPQQYTGLVPFNPTQLQ